MFCTYCRAPLQPDQRFCGRCGNPTVASVPLQPAAGRVASHARTLGMLWIAFSALHLLRGGGVLLGARMVRLIGRDWSDDVPWGWPAGTFSTHFISLFSRRGGPHDGGDWLPCGIRVTRAPSMGAQPGYC